MPKNYDIIIVSTSRWDDTFSSVAFSWAKEFAKHNRVFLIDHPYSLKEFLTEYSKGNKVKSRKSALLYGKDIYKKIEGLPANLTVVTPRLTFPINWLGEGALYNSLSKVNEKILYSTLRQVVKDNNVKEYIFINSYDPFFLRDIPKDVKAKLTVYQTIDDISQETYIARHGIRLEKEAMKNADITLATSKELTRIASQYANQVYCVPNAADFTLFQKAVTEKLNRPKELVGVTQKVICYTGNISIRLNYDLLRKVAQFHTDKLLLMVGPTNNDDYKKAGLDKLPNVLFTGSRDITELPSYLQHSDCVIIPFEYSILTKSIYPLKINEYLTAGKPVVATAFSEDIKDFSDVAYIAQTEDDFIASIDQAINENEPERIEARIKKAEANSWQARVARFWEIVDSNLVLN